MTLRLGIIFWIGSVLVVNVGCASAPELPPTDSSPRQPEDPPAAILRPISYSQDADSLIVWFTENPGNISPEYAEYAHAHRYRWKLYGDGTAEYITGDAIDGYERYRVQLTAEERKEIVHLAVAAVIESSRDGRGDIYPPLGAGSCSLGVAFDGEQMETGYLGWRMLHLPWEGERPTNARWRILERITSFSPPRAKRIP